VVAAFLPGRLTLAVRVYALIACAALLGSAVSALRRSYPPATPLRMPKPRGFNSRRPPPTLARLEHEVALGLAGAVDLHYRLAPHIRALAAELLSSRRRISIEAEPDTARLVLGDETWSLVRDDRPPPDDRRAHGLTEPELLRVVESLERV
jgi:hypothetical protein